jgi:hypothetical protein
LLIKLRAKSFLSSNWEVDTKELLKQEKIGSGAAGPVYRGIYKGTQVAIKDLSVYYKKQHNADFENKFKKEVQFLSTFHHVRLVWIVSYFY